MNIADCIVVGSGCSGAMASQTLVEGGLNVTMLDVGVMRSDYHRLVPKEDYLTLRKNDPEQYKYLIGEHVEGVVWGDLGKGAQLTPPRQFLTEYVSDYLPLSSKTFSPLESLAYGGLGSGWGLQCWEFSDSDIEITGLNKAAMPDAYEVVSRRIGISANQDSGASHSLIRLRTFQSAPAIDRNHGRIFKKYQEKQESFTRAGIYMGRTPLALITKDLGYRKAYRYRDMDFYDDNDQSAWRPWMTIDALRRRDNFTYVNGQLVLSFKEKKDHVEVRCVGVPDNKPNVFRCKKLILASGALGSGRIVLRSQHTATTKLPILCNPYTFIPCVQPSMFGKSAEPKKMGFGQLSLFLDPTGEDKDLSIASLYGYQSLMQFRTIRQIPFVGLRDARSLLQYLMTGIVIMGVQHPDMPSSQKYLRLVRDRASPTGDRAEATYSLDAKTAAEFKVREAQFIRAVRRCGLYPTKRIYPGHGSSIHYAGTIPYSTEEKPNTLAPDGRLHGTKRVFIADSSGFKALPARGLTFSLMANAHLTAQKVLGS